MGSPKELAFDSSTEDLHDQAWHSVAELPLGFGSPPDDLEIVWERLNAQHLPDRPALDDLLGKPPFQPDKPLRGLGVALGP